MPTTLATARLALRERLSEYQARGWKDTALERWLNEGAKDIARKAEVLQATADVVINASVNSGTLPVDVIRVHRAEWESGGQTRPLEYRDFNSAQAVSWMDPATNQGNPALYTMWGVAGGIQVILYPTPATTGTLHIYYYKLPTAVAEDTDVFDLPEGWEDAMYLYAEMVALRADRDPRWQEAKQLYDEALGSLFDVSRRYTDGAGLIVGNLPAINDWLYEMD